MALGKTCDLLVDPSSLSCEIMIKRIIQGIVANEMYQEHRLNEVGIPYSLWLYGR